MNPQVLIDSASGSGHLGDEMELAGAVRLLQRRGHSMLVGISLDPGISIAQHPGMEFAGEERVVAALEDAQLLCITGHLRGARLGRAARHLALAKMAGVPTALVSVRVDVEAAAQYEPLLRQLLSQAESVSARDAASAARFAAWRGRRVETVAPLELLLDEDVAARGCESWCVAVESEFLESLRAEEREGLDCALRALRADVRLVGADLPPGVAPRTPQTGSPWRVGVRAVAACNAVLARPGSPLLAVAAVHGTAPCALGRAGERSDLHARLGLAVLECSLEAGPQAMRALLDAARRCDARTLRQRGAPLRALAWRALGPLSEAARAQALQPARWDAASRRVLAQACGEHASPALESGDAERAGRLLEPWRETLDAEPRWAEARARAWALAGGERQACNELERALAATPADAGCRMALARMRTLQGDLAAARAAWQELARQQPEAAEPWFELGSLELLGGSGRDALRCWQEALLRQPEHAPTRRSVRQCLHDDHQTATSFWEGLCERQPDRAAFWLEAGRAREACGSWSRAASNLRRAALLDPALREVEEALARVDPHVPGDLPAPARTPQPSASGTA